MSDPRVPDGELNPQEILDPEGVDPDLVTDEQHQRRVGDEPLDDPEGDERRDGNDVQNPLP